MITSPVSADEHPFAQYIRILGKGKKGTRSLTQAEAEAAMAMLLQSEVTDTQLGAFLMLLRHKEESPEEMAGFTQAVRAEVKAPAIALDLDWPSYAGKRRQLPWHLLAARCLAHQGLRILIHGAGAHTAGRLYTEQLLEVLDIPRCSDWQQVGQALDTQQLAFMPLACWMPPLQRLIDLRNVLGLRSSVHSLVRLINPLGARCGLQSIFHPGYQEIHRKAACLLGDTALVIKGEGGEMELNPEAETHLYGSLAGTPWNEDWPALLERRQLKPKTLEPAHLLTVWRGEAADTYGEQAVIGTMALALRGLGMASEGALAEAARYWQQRRA